MCISQSKAWDAKIVTSAFWVYANQVSKIGPDGAELPSGKVILNGKVRWLPPIQLVYGFGLLFEISPDDIERHYFDRRPWERDGISTKENDIVTDITFSAEGHTEIVALEDDVLNEIIALEAERIDIEFPDTVIAAENTMVLPIHYEEDSDIEDFSATIAPEIIAPLMSVKPLSRSIRGKRGKEKKIKNKYADQDDEDKLLMQELMAADQGPQPKGKKEKAKAAKVAEAHEREKIYLEKVKLTLPNDSKKKEREPSQVFTPQSSPEVLDYLDVLTGQPAEDDAILHCIPVCAPWITLQKYKYKIKLIPGSSKRGKAAKVAVDAFAKMMDGFGDAGIVEKDLLMGVSDATIVQTMISKVKVVSIDNSRKGKSK